MAFDPNNFKSDEPRYYPVILLLDLSGSMNAVESGDIVSTGEIIYLDGQQWEVVKGGTTRCDALYQAVKDMVDSFAAQRSREKMIKVAIITFSGRSATLHTSYTDAPDLQAQGIQKFSADDETPLGAALKKAKELLEDRNVTPGRWYVPYIVLVSDGRPNDRWEEAFQDFIQNGRSAKCTRIAVPIGLEADIAMMERFTGDRSLVFFAQDAGSIAESFKQVVMSVTKSLSAVKTINTATATVKRSVRTTVRRVPRHDDNDEE